MKATYANILGFLLLSLFCYVILLTFYTDPIHIWDEAVYANNALEMAHSKNPFVLTLDDKPSLYNTKPPFAIWLMAISIRLFGANEIAVRLPSIISFGLLIIFIIRFSKKQFGNYLVGYIASFILLGSSGLIISHGVRSGDLDSMVLLFITIFNLWSIELLLIEDPTKQTIKTSILKIGMVTFLAFMTKSTAIFLFAPGLLFSFFTYRNKKLIFQTKYIYVVTVGLFVLILTYYLLMNFLYPEYISKVFHSEYERAYKNIMPWHRQPMFWYFQRMATERFFPFLFLVIPFSIIGFCSKTKIVSAATRYLVIVTICYLLLISFIPDKLDWYDLPLYPLFALLIGIGTLEIFYFLLRKYRLSAFSYLLITIAVLLVLSIRLRNSFVNNPVVDELEKASYSIKEIKAKHLAYNLKVYMPVEHPMHTLSVDFYRKIYKNDLNITVLGRPDQIQVGDTVLISENNIQNLKKDFRRLRNIYTFKYAHLFVLTN